MMEILLQVNGKTYSKGMVNEDDSTCTIKSFAMGDPKITSIRSGRPIKKVVYIPNKLVNIII